MPSDWSELLKDPLIRGVIAIATFVSIIIFGNDLRKRLFQPLAIKSDDDSITQELRALRDSWKDLAQARAELIDELDRDNTDLRKELKKHKTRPIDNETLDQLQESDNE